MNDNKSTLPTDFTDFAHKYSMENDKRYAHGYNALKKWESGLGQQGLEDQSLIMALAADGLKPLVSYSMAPIHLANRVVRAVQYADPKKAFGLPGVSEIKSAIASSGRDRDKLLWKSTATAAKLNSLYGLE